MSDKKVPAEGEKKITPADGGNSKAINELLRLLSVGGDLNETQQKQMKDYKFWKTQPVPSLDSKIDLEGPIESKSVSEIPAEPLPLLGEFEWNTMDITSDLILEEVYQLLYEHYVEDQDATFRFKYSHEFLRWAMQPPGWKKEWYVGVRVRTTGKLVAFISAIPITLYLNKLSQEIKSVEINFLCVHKKLRQKRLAPILIKEITRRVNRENIWQALYTAGVVLPSPVASCRYTHRPLNWGKLNDVGFSHLPQRETRLSMAAQYALPSATKTEGLRVAKFADIDQIHTLFNTYQKKFDLVQVFTKEDLSHWLLDKGDSTVIKTYVVEKDGRITDFFSYYLLPFSVLGNEAHSELGIAYLYYYATELTEVKQRLGSLMQDALITAKTFGVDVFNCLTSQDNTYFIKDLKFGSGDGFLNYYLFNYKTWPLEAGVDKQTKDVLEDATSGVGVVLL